MVDFLFRNNWTFFASSYCWSRRFSKEVSYVNANFTWKGRSPANPSWCQKTIVMALSHRIKIFRHNARVWRTDRQTDRQIDRQTDRQNYDSQDRASIAALCGKNSSNVPKGLNGPRQFWKLKQSLQRLYSAYHALWREDSVPTIFFMFPTLLSGNA